MTSKKAQTPKLHIISGLPRSGSTLLSALLSQNPEIHAGISSPLLSSILALRDVYNTQDATALSLIDEKEQLQIYRQLIGSYYETRRHGRGIVFDTNRGWTGHLNLLDRLSPESKVIACVRNLEAIVDSVERIFRQNPFILPKLFGGPQEWQSMNSRVDTVLNANRLVGQPWTALQEAVYSEHSSKVLLVDYDLLATSPLDVIACIYDFLEMPRYTKHNVNNVELLASEAEKIQKFDDNLSAPNLHKVEKEVTYQARQSVLTPDVLEKLKGLNFWRNLQGSDAKLLTRM